MWFVDDESIDTLRRGDRSRVREWTVAEGRPYVDIELVADAHQTELSFDEVERRYRRLRKPFADKAGKSLLAFCGDLAGPAAQDLDAVAALWRQFLEKRAAAGPVLVVPGDCDVLAAGGLALEEPATDVGTGSRGAAQVWANSGRFYRAVLPNAIVEQDVRESCDLPVAELLRVVAADHAGDDATDLAYVLLLGFDSNAATYRGEPGNAGEISALQLDQAGRLVSALTADSGLAASLPLYVIGVTHHSPFVSEGGDGVTDGQPAGAMRSAWEFLRRCHHMRMSLVVHGDMSSRDLLDVTATPLVAGRSGVSVPVAPAPSFRSGRLSSGMARLRLDVRQGEAQLAFSYDRGPDGELTRPVQVVRPLLSASRVSAGEQRLRNRMRTEIPKLADRESPESTVLTEFEKFSDELWEAAGYVAVTRPDGQLPSSPDVRFTRYNLLLLLREREGGGYDVLLSNHTPLRFSEFADWDSLLLPAFKDVRALLQHLREDVLRQVADQAETLEKVDQARAFEQTVGDLLVDEDVWHEEIREVQATTVTKFSPTDGRLTTYDYRLVTLLPLVRRLEGEPGSHDSVEERARRELIRWLAELPALRRAAERSTGSVLPLDLVLGSGPGLRWVPSTPAADGPIPLEPSPTLNLPPGAIWFPLPEIDDERSPWEDCAPILARNADVMSWLDDVLARLRRPDGSFPPELVLGRAEATGEAFEIIEQFPFELPADAGPVAGEAASDGLDEGSRARSTREAMARVHLLAGFDLSHVLPYADREIVPVWLTREDMQVGGRTRTAIVVRDKSGERLGLLRPVQRYVLRAGVERAEQVHDQVIQRLCDQWGFAEVRRGPSVKPIVVTSPIIEQIALAEQEDDRFGAEFVLCDGNHRVVANLWNPAATDPTRKLAAVAVQGDPVEPFYAHPFSAFEWGVTARNVRAVTPDQDSKYLVRDVAGLPADVQEKLAGQPQDKWYRRWFRDFTTGFGDVGGQGGRPR